VKANLTKEHKLLAPLTTNYQWETASRQAQPGCRHDSTAI